MTSLLCYRCGTLFTDDPDFEGPSDYCLQCRHELVHEHDDDDDAEAATGR